MYHSVYYRDNTEDHPAHRPFPHYQNRNNQQFYFRGRRMAHPQRAQSAQSAPTAPANRPDRHNLAACHHKRKAHPDPQDRHQRFQMRACVEVPLFVYPYIPYTMEQPSCDDHQPVPEDKPTKNQESPARHDCHTSAHAHQYHNHHCRCHCHHADPPRINHDYKRNRRCYYDHDQAANSPQFQPRTSHSGIQAKHEDHGKTNDTSDAKNQNHTSPRLTARWIWGPPLPGFVLARPTDAPKYKHS